MRSMDVEAALRWAYRDELPKAQRGERTPYMRSGWAAMESYVELLAKIDANAFGCVPDLFALEPPHPDALALGRAVQGLDELALGVPEGWDPLADLGEMRASCAGAVQEALAAETIVTRAGERAFRTKPSALVLRHAVLGGAPDWACEKPKLVVVRWEANGIPRWFRRIRVWEGDIGRNPELGCWREVEVDGFNAKRRRPWPDAYRKYELDPDPTLAIVGRIEYEVWRSALDWLVDECPLATLRLTRSPRALRPWETGEPPPPRVWRAAA